MPAGICQVCEKEVRWVAGFGRSVITVKCECGGDLRPRVPGTKPHRCVVCNEIGNIPGTIIKPEFDFVVPPSLGYSDKGPFPAGSPVHYYHRPTKAA